MRDLDDGNVGQQGRETVFGELCFSFCGIVNDKSEQTELGRVSKAERENIYVVFLKNAENL